MRSATLRRALTWYVVWSLVALVLVGAAAVALSSLIARDEALDDARATARAVADQIVAPLGSPAFHAGDPAAQAALTQAIDSRTRDGSVRHVKIWADAGSGSGRIVWADEAELLGQDFVMEPEEYALFGGTGIVSEVSDLAKDENELERPEGQLVEVYAGFTDAAGSALVFEAYLPTEPLAAKTSALVNRLLPLMLGALIILELTTLPLAVSLARRVDHAQADRESLLQHAVDSSDQERRRIAQDLHDGVIQDLAGVGYALASISMRTPDPDSRESLDHAGDTVRRDVAALRTLMTDIYPPDLDTRGLPDAVRDLVGQNGFGRTMVTVEVDEPLTPSPVTARVAFRVVRESLRNVVKHSRATRASVRLHQDGDRLLVDVSDDGVGFQPEQGARPGHLGQQLLRDTVADAGGHLVVTSAPGEGTRVSAALPL